MTTSKQFALTLGSATPTLHNRQSLPFCISVDAGTDTILDVQGTVRHCKRPVVLTLGTFFIHTHEGTGDRLLGVGALLAKEGEGRS